MVSIVLVQKNFIVGNIEHNIGLIKKAVDDNKNADLLVFPELCICGYPPEDLLLKSSFIERCKKAVDNVIKYSKNSPALILPTPWEEGGILYNAALLIENGRITHKQYKHTLPNYGVFDEKRWFKSKDLPKIIDFKGTKIGLFICEDMWDEPVQEHLKNADIFISVNASPFDTAKHQGRLEKAKNLKKPVYYVNHIGGQDGLVFDGGSFVFENDKYLTPPFYWQEGYVKINDKPPSPALHSSYTHIYQALVLGLKDYIKKNGFKKVVLGLSGGIDSALTLALAVDGLGAENVKTFMLSSRYTSKSSLEDAAKMAELVGVEHQEISIEETYKTILDTLDLGNGVSITEENIQSRIRGTMLMAIANKHNYLLLATGNKSELAVGYCTLYGDMCGAYAVLGDVYKTLVFELSKFRNENFFDNWLGKAGAIIPERIITKEPSAELKEGQKDSDSLPKYEVLDGILAQLIEGQKSWYEITDFDQAIAKRIEKLLKRAEYKRFQAAPMTKITPMVFGRDRRYPITNGE